MPLSRYTIFPWLGTKTSVPADDPTLFMPLGRGFATNDVGGQHFDLKKTRNACSKADGYTVIGSYASATSGLVHGLFELYDGSNRDRLMAYNGRLYKLTDYAGSYVWTDISPTLAEVNTESFHWSMGQYGSYLIYSDDALHTPYKWKNGDSVASKLILSGEEYKFKFLEFFQGRILGAYSDQTNGDIEMRWTEVLPGISTLSFPATNQLYKPGTDSIVAIRRLGANACYLYGLNTINRIDYYPDFSAPFVITELVNGQSCSNFASLVAIPNRHFFFNRNYGFVEYAGGTDWSVISDDIEDKLDMRWEYAKRCVGAFDPVHKEVVWLVTTDEATESTPNAIFRYDLKSRQWRNSPWPMHYIDRWVVLTSGKTWQELYTTDQHQTWQDVINAGHYRWIDIYQEHQRLVMGTNNGYVYYEGGNSQNGSDYNSYRIEPVMDFDDPNRKKLLLEIWMGFGKIGTYYVDLYWRGGDTAAECESHDWESIGTIRPCAATSAAVAYLGKNERFHQIKWGTDKAQEQFEVNRIDFYFAPQGKY
jgi:hypothetical protein